MNINFELYKIFYAVAAHENITKAANELFISQPAVSKSIKNLEEQLGGQLFLRHKRGVILTESGKKLFDSIKLIMEQIKAAENQFSDFTNLKTGKIKIGVSTTIAREFLMKYLNQYHVKYPDIDIKIDTDPAVELLAKLNSGILDVVFVTLPMDIPNDIDIINCSEIHDCLISSHNYDIRDNLNIGELNNYPLILQDKNSNTRKFLDDHAFKQSVILKPGMELSSYSLVVDFIKLGLGIGFATYEYINKEIANNNLKIITLNPKLPTRYIAIALPKNQSISFATKQLVEIVMSERNNGE